MKLKTICALIGASTLCPLATAQSSVSVYGLLDTGLTYGRFSASGSTRTLAPNTMAGSRLGFRGSEDLGGGLKAGFQLEHGLLVDSGSAGSSTNFWNRGSWVFVASESLGEFRLGRQRSSIHWIYLAADPSGYGLATLGSQNTLHSDDALYRSGTSVFFDNSLVYRSPKLGRLSLELSTSFGAEKSGVASADGRTMGFNLQYTDGALWLGGGYQRFTQHETAIAADRSQDTYLVGARYTTGAVTVAGDLVHARRDMSGRPRQSSGGGLQVKVAIGAGAIDVGIAALQQTGGQKARAFHAGYVHNLSKRTGIYAYTGKVFNNTLSAITYAAPIRNGTPLGRAGFDPAAVTLGLRHTF